MAEVCELPQMRPKLCAWWGKKVVCGLGDLTLKRKNKTSVILEERMCVPPLLWGISRGYRDDSSCQCCSRSGPLVSLSHSYFHTHTHAHSSLKSFFFFFPRVYHFYTDAHTQVWNLRPFPLSICKGYLCDTSSQPSLWLISTHHTHLCTGTWQPGCPPCV